MACSLSVFDGIILPQRESARKGAFAVFYYTKALLPLQARPGRAQSDRRDSAALTGKTIDGAVFGE